jgi:hypothetical protein
MSGLQCVVVPVRPGVINFFGCFNASSSHHNEFYSQSYSYSSSVGKSFLYPCASALYSPGINSPADCFRYCSVIEQATSVGDKAGYREWKPSVVMD